MSSILKALKKLEEEKSFQKSGKEINISQEILKPQAEHSNSVRWLWLPGSVALALIMILATALFRSSSSKKETRIQPQVLISPGLPSLAPPPAPPALRSLSDDRKNIGKPPSSTVKTLNQEPPKPLAERSRVRSSIKTELPNTPAVYIELPKTDFKANTPPPSQLPKSFDSSLTLSGIAWNKDSSDRLAIINGQPTATGASVDGAVVEEILPDKVRMNLSGRTFELFLGRQQKTN